MVNKQLDEQGYKIIAEDSEMEVRLDPREERGYLLCIKGDDNKFILFPRGTLEDVAKTDRDTGKRMIENLVQIIHGNGRLFEGTKLNYDSIIAIVTKAYLKEEEDYQLSKH